MSHSVEIRPMIAEDISPLVEIAEATGVFRPLEIEVLAELLDDYLSALANEEQHQCQSLLVGEELAGFVYYAPTPMTEATWYLYWIVVDATRQRHGFGKLLLGHVEESIRQHGGKTLVIETSMLPTYQATRQFYLKNGYTFAGEIPNYYADGDGMGIFYKSLECS
ncbi:MAG: GNAT family N-acetyltransferase [Gemmataceae bacterium]|jgi:ribosomal protein S18 acetylase RimI-like enzyme|nr:GNAT family N-acetyltransferase [Gemmataceae bacterium]